MSVNANNNNLGKQEISNLSPLPFVSETNKSSNDRIKKIIKDSLFIPSTNVTKYLEMHKMQLIKRASYTFVLSESTYEESSNSSLVKKTLCQPVNSSNFSIGTPFDMYEYQNTFFIVNDQSTQLKNVELYVNKHFKFDGFKVKVNENGNPIFDKHIFCEPSPMTSISLYGQTDFGLSDGTISYRTVCLFTGELNGFIDESSLNYLKTPQSQFSYSLLQSSNEDIDAIVKHIKTDPKI